MNKAIKSVAVIAAALTFSLVAPVYTGNIAQANAASASTTVATKNLGKVTVKKITNKKVAKNKKATVKPNIKKTGKTKIVKKVITVKQGKKTIAKNKASVKLKTGTYKVTTTVKYKVKVKKGSKTTWSKTKTKKVSQTLKITKKATPTKATHKINTKAGQSEFVKLINKERKAKGLNALVLDSELSNAAKLYSTGKSADRDKLIDPNYNKKWNITNVTKYMEDGYEITETQLRVRTFGGVSSSGNYGSVPSDTFFGFLKMDKSLNDFWKKADGVGMYSNGKTVFVIFGTLK